jgi:hypothetical protein
VSQKRRRDNPFDETDKPDDHVEPLLKRQKASSPSEADRPIPVSERRGSEKSQAGVDLVSPLEKSASELLRNSSAVDKLSNNLDQQSDSISTNGYYSSKEQQSHQEVKVEEEPKSEAPTDLSQQQSNKEILPPTLLSTDRCIKMSEDELTSFCDNILQENRRLAESQQKRFLLDFKAILNSGQPKIRRNIEDYPLIRENITSHARFRPFLVRHIAAQKSELLEKHIMLRGQYKEHHEQWKKRTEKQDNPKRKRKSSSGVPTTVISQQAMSTPASSMQLSARHLAGELAGKLGAPSLSRSSRRSGGVVSAFTSDSVKSEAEWQEVLAMIAASDGAIGATPEELKMVAQCAKDPPMLLDPLERKIFLFQNNNSLVQDPETALAAENSNIDLKWTDEEREIFKLRLVQYGKNFPKIATYLSNKTTQDCVQYYYREKFTYNFKQLIKRGTTGRGMKRKAVAPPKKVVSVSVPSKPEVPQLAKARASLLGQADSRLTPVPRLPVPSEDDNEELPKKKSPHDDPQPQPQPQPKPKLKKPEVEEPTTPVDDNRWTVDEKGKALEAFAKYGKDFAAVGQSVGSKTADQCRAFYQLYKHKLRLDSVIEDAEASKDKDSMKKKKDAKKMKDKVGKPEKKKEVTIPKPASSAKSKRKDEAVVDEVMEDAMHEDIIPEEVQVKLTESAAVDGDDPYETTKLEKIDYDAHQQDDIKRAKKKKQKKRTDGTADVVEEEALPIPEVLSPHLSQADMSSPQGLRKTVSYWSRSEKDEFVKALRRHGRNWEAVARVIGSKSAVQSRNYYVNFRDKMNFDGILLDAGHSIGEEIIGQMSIDTEHTEYETTDVPKLEEQTMMPRVPAKVEPPVQPYTLTSRNPGMAVLLNEDDARIRSNSQPASAGPLISPPFAQQVEPASPQVARGVDEPQHQHVPNAVYNRPPHVVYAGHPAPHQQYHPMYPPREAVPMHYPHSQEYPGASYSMSPYVDIVRGPPPGHQPSAGYMARVSGPPGPIYGAPPVTHVQRIYTQQPPNSAPIVSQSPLRVSPSTSMAPPYQQVRAENQQTGGHVYGNSSSQPPPPTPSHPSQPTSQNQQVQHPHQPSAPHGQFNEYIYNQQRFTQARGPTPPHVMEQHRGGPIPVLNRPMQQPVNMHYGAPSDGPQSIHPQHHNQGHVGHQQHPPQSHHPQSHHSQHSSQGHGQHPHQQHLQHPQHAQQYSQQQQTSQHPPHHQQPHHPQHPQHVPHSQHTQHPQHPQHSQHPQRPQHPQHMQHSQHPQHPQHIQHPQPSQHHHQHPQHPQQPPPPSHGHHHHQHPQYPAHMQHQHPSHPHHPHHPPPVVVQGPHPSHPPPHNQPGPHNPNDSDRTGVTLPSIHNLIS